MSETTEKVRKTPTQKATILTQRVLDSIAKLEGVGTKLETAQKTAVLAAIQTQTEQLTQVFAGPKPTKATFTLPTATK